MRGVAQPRGKGDGHQDGRALLQDPRAVRGAWRCGVQLQLRALWRYVWPGNEHVGDHAPRAGGLLHRLSIPVTVSVVCRGADSLWATDPAASVAVDRPNGRGRDRPHQDPRQAGQLCRQADHLGVTRCPATGGVVDLRDELRRARLMAITPVDEVWGIGRRLGAKLVAQGIHTVADLVASDAKGLRTQYGVVVERIIQELRGLPCAELTVERWRSSRSSRAVPLGSE